MDTAPAVTTRQPRSSAVRAWLKPAPSQRLHIGRACIALLLVVASSITGLAAFVVMPSLYLDRRNLPDLGPFLRFEFPAIGTIYDANDHPLVQLAVEKRVITQYEDIPPIVREAVLTAEDRRFFSHNGVDYFSLPRVLSKVRLTQDTEMFPQGGSTITQQLVRGLFLQKLTSLENSDQLQSRSLAARLLAGMLGARQVNRLLRKHEEMRLSVWLEREMRFKLGSKMAAKKAILARYASFVYMGQGQYGFAKAADHYFGRPLPSLGVDDADKAAVLAGIMKAPRDYAPVGRGSEAVLRRRNLILGQMARHGVITPDHMAQCRQRPVVGPVGSAPTAINSAAVVQHTLSAFASSHPELNLDALMQGRIHVYSTVDAGIQQIASDALERGLSNYEKRRPRSRGTVQGAVIVLRNSDGAILSEIGGRQVYLGRPATYVDFNRVTQSMRQPGSAMKPIVYLAAFRRGGFTLDTLVPDEPVSVPDDGGAVKWISNYDGEFKGMVPLRKAFAESRNTVAVWMASQVGIDSVLYTARTLGIQTPLKRYPTTALGASEMSLLELATAYRTMASGVLVQPYLIRRVIDRDGDPIGGYRSSPSALQVQDAALVMVQEALRGVVRMPTGTAHALSTSKNFPLAVMGKTGTTSDFRDAVFVGLTYGVGGITVAVRVGFDDNRTLGSGETGGRLAMPIFQDIMRKVYNGGLVGPAPQFPRFMEQSITDSLQTQKLMAMLPTLSVINFVR